MLVGAIGAALALAGVAAIAWGGIAGEGSVVAVGLALLGSGLVLAGVALLFFMSFSPFASEHYTDKPKDAPDYDA